MNNGLKEEIHILCFDEHVEALKMLRKKYNVFNFKICVTFVKRKCYRKQNGILKRMNHSFKQGGFTGNIMLRLCMQVMKTSTTKH